MCIIREWGSILTSKVEPRALRVIKLLSIVYSPLSIVFAGRVPNFLSYTKPNHLGYFRVIRFCAQIIICYLANNRSQREAPLSYYHAQSAPQIGRLIS